MLRLRKVEIFGFKSFAERTRIVFNGAGIAAVVGPNGCGKSNIADSILWVLGEQSAKTLRSGRMADCIFNGTASRPPTNLAEVTLTLVDPEAEKPLQNTGETPRLDSLRLSSGQAGQAPVPPTAAPPVEVLATGETPRLDSLRLSSGQAGQAPVPPEEKKRKNRLNLKILPGEVVVTRRLYRDGTSEYYLNGELCRLRDIQELFMGTGLGPESYAIIEQGRIGQILSSRPSDRRGLLEEAAGVTKYKTKRRLAEAKLESAHQNLLRVNDILEEISKQLNSLKRQAARARRYQELKAEGTGLRRQLLATQLDQLGAAAAALAAQLQTNGAELEQDSAAVTELDNQLTAARNRQYELESLLRQEQNRAGQVLVELERAQTRLADARRQQQETAQRLSALASQQQSLTGEAATAAASAEQSRQGITQLEQDFAATARQLEALAAESRQLHRQFAGAPLETETLAAEANPAAVLARARAERDCVQELVVAAQQGLAQAQQEAAAQQKRVEELRESLATAVAEQKALGELVAQRAALAEPVQRLLLGAGGGSAVPQSGIEFRAVGVVADFAEFEPDYAPLLEDYLHDEMEYVVVETYDAARSGVSLLREQAAGRATFLVDSFGRFPPKLAEQASRAPQGAELIGPVADFVRMNGALGSEAKRVLPKLGRTYLVESARAAEELAREFPHFFFLSTDGTCYHGRLVSGGAPNGHGTHRLNRELERAARQRGEIEPAARTAEAELARVEDRQRRLTATVEAGRQALLAHEKNLLQLEQQHDALAAARAEQARLEEAARRLALGQQEQNKLARQLSADLERLEQEIPAREAEVRQRQQDKLAQEERCQQGEAELVGLRETLVEREAALRERRAQLEAVREQRHALEIEQARQQSERQHAEIALQSEFGLTAEQLLAQVPERLAGDALAQAELRYAEIRQRLENIGPVNMMALEEYQECEQRHQFLTQQREDLLASIADTQRAISEIDEVCRQQFEQAFTVINQNFAETFRTLFGGGTATLRLTNEEDQTESGVELICQPPGKRLQNVLLLSGGEKALTALALLIAIFRYQPSPFCILDEVDAPLDDTNVGRFTKLVQEMAPQTQFILITHNKKTMEVAPVLYGVTMQSAVTQIVSVRFDEQKVPASAA